MLLLQKEQTSYSRPTPWKAFFQSLPSMLSGQPSPYQFYDDSRGQTVPASVGALCRFMGQSIRYGFLLRVWTWRWENKEKTE